MLAYLDTSLVVSVYTIDVNSSAAVTALSQCDELPVLSTLCQLEVINAFSLQVFRKDVTTQRSQFALASFEEDIRGGIYQLKELPEAVFPRARKLSRDWTPLTGIRTADLLHVALALELGASKLLSFDVQQRRLAEAVGLELNLLA